MAVFKTYASVGAKEDVSDVISMLTPHKVPFSSSIGNDTVKQKIYQWQEDALEAGADNAQIEGFDATEEAITSTSLLQNTTQIFSRTIKISGSVEATDHYGRASETARQLVKKGKSLRLDLERSRVGVDQVTVLGGDAVARRSASVSQLIAAGNKTAVAGALTEAATQAAIRLAYASGSDGAETFMVRPLHAEVISTFAGTATRMRDVGAEATKIVQKVDIYVTALGTLRVVINRELKSDFALLYDPSMWKSVALKGRSWFRETLAKTGDNEKIMLVGEYGLKHENQLGAVLLTGLTGG
jgi:hypothetical protein